MTKTTPKLQLVDAPAARPDFTEQIAAPLAAATRSGARGRAGPTKMSALRAARLSAWRELHSRWMVFAMLPALMAAGSFWEGNLASAWTLFLALTIAPLAVVLAAAGGRPEADSFWRGLGGPAWARQLGRQAVHLVLIGVAIAVLFMDRETVELMHPLSESTLGPTYLLLYASVAAARTRLSGIRLLLGPLAGFLILVVGTLSSLYVMHDWSPQFAGWVRLFGVIAAALIASYRWERSAGVWGGTVQRGRLLTPARWVLALMCASAGVEFLWSSWLLPPNTQVLAIAEDGEVVLRRAGQMFDDNGSRYWTETDGGVYRIPGRQHYGLTGPGGGVITFRNETILQTGEWDFIDPKSGDAFSSFVITLTQGKQSLSCPLDVGVVPYRLQDQVTWRSDGRAALFTNGSADDQLLFDLDSGACTPLSNRTYLGDALLEIGPQGARWGDQEVAFSSGAAVPHRWDAWDDAALVLDPEGRFYSLAISEQQLTISGPFSKLEDSIVVQNRGQTAVWAWRDGEGYRRAPMVAWEGRLSYREDSTLRVDDTSLGQRAEGDCFLPEDLRSDWVYLGKGLQFEKGDGGSLSPRRPGENSRSGLRVSTNLSHCQALDAELFVGERAVEVGQSSVRWNGQEVPFSSGPPTAGEWDGRGDAVLIRGPEDLLYSVAIDDDALSVSGPFSTFEASGALSWRSEGRWHSDRVMTFSADSYAVDVLDGTSWDLASLKLNQSGLRGKLALRDGAFVSLIDLSSVSASP